MELEEERNLILRVTKYALKNKKFRLDKLETDLKLDEYDFSFLKTTLTSHSKSSENPNHILVAYNMAFHKTSIVPDQDKSEYSLLPNAYYNYVDYLEIIEARKVAEESRKHAEQAQKSSDKAIKIAMWAFIIAFFQIVVEVIGLFKS